VFLANKFFPREKRFPSCFQRIKLKLGLIDIFNYTENPRKV
jgi:hypothetical protein